LIDDHLVSGTYDFARLGDANPDGWGLAWFTPLLLDPGPGYPLIARGRPKASSVYDARFAESVARMIELEADLAIAHVRRASTGTVQVPDPHPLFRDGIVFAHNGTIDTTALVTLLEEGEPDYLTKNPPDYIDRYLDSELYFLYILRLREEGVETGAGPLSHALGDAIAEAARRAHQMSAIQTAANCLAVLGDTLFAMRFDPNDRRTYKLRYRACSSGWEVASEPVGTDTTGWEEFPPKSLGIFRADAVPVFVSVFPPDMPYLDLGARTIDDDTLGGSAGNGDSGCDAGERIELRVTVENAGGQPATQVQGVLATEDAYCTILDDVESFGDIAPGEQSLCAEDYDFAISPACPPGHEATFSITLTCEGRPSWVRHFTLPIQAPLLEAAGFTISDPAGDGDGRIDPGETVDLTLTLANHGTEEATHLGARLATAHPFVVILTDTASLAALAPGEQLALAPPFALSIDPACPDPEALLAEIFLSADWGWTGEVQVEIPIGGFFDDIESGPGGWTTYPVEPSWADQWHRSTARNFTPEGEWSWKFGDPGAGVYADHADGALEMPAVTLRPVSILRFRHWMQAELKLGSSVYCNDGGRVEMSVDGGPWQPIVPLGGYPCRIGSSTDMGPWLPGTSVYSGSIDWEEAVFEIADRSGTAAFRFRFGSNGSGGAEGWYIDDVEFYGYDPAMSALDEEGAVLERPAWRANPNPFRGSTELAFTLARPAEVGLEIFDASGRRVRALAAGLLDPGFHRVAWDGRDDRGLPCGSGLYLCRVAASDEAAVGAQTIRIVKVR